ncbi:hypothetical protein C4S77_01340 [Apibacter adventoris]|uniref:Glycosyltransferase RgtA/B/C/D-like domain-containing protein n=2 Tax=Apibacter adventoris TaxID=1679466 RepID=A0A2S8AGI3_9FLAO|nr:hypothetical protein C4S77_01340 [Apibacter adventoris]
MKYINIKNCFLKFIKILFPSTRNEGIIFLMLLILYIPLGIYFSFFSTIIYNEKIPWDIYFSFDNRSIILSGGMIEKHPFSYYFIMPIFNLANWFYHINNNLGFFNVIFTVFCAVNVSLGIVFVYKYLTNIINLKTKTTYLIIIFYTFFSTNILLSFTPETYTFSIFLLSFYTYISALFINRQKKIPLIFNTIMGIFIGGETITNLPKTYIPLFFENKKFNLKEFLTAALKTLFSIVIFVLLYLWRRDWDYMKILSKSATQYEKFSNPKGETWWNMITSYFFGGNMLFPSFIEKNLRFFKIQYKALYYHIYDQPLQYIFCLSIFLFMIGSLIANRKNKLLYILGFSFLIDIIIHGFMKFGLWVSFIYGGHWVFVVPLLLGWLFYALRNNKKIYKMLFIFLGLLTLYLIINNLFRLSEFINFVNKYYKI